MKSPSRVPGATYRVQLHAGFTFSQLAGIIPYLHELGITDVYASPIFRAAPGSTHGYDVCDQNEVNPELGGREGLAQVSALLRERDMGLLADFVPNHMGIEGPHNWRWLDVLENGQLSPYAPFFDIHWNPRQAALQERILVPMLHDFYGRVLEEGGIRLEYAEGAFAVAYGSLRFPLSPDSHGTVLDRLAWFKNPGSPVAQKLEQMAARFRVHPDPAVGETLEQAQHRQREGAGLRRELVELIEGEGMHGDLQQVLRALNGTPGEPASFNNLHDILEAQHYRLAYWKSGTHEINYRRFFAVDTLVGLHMERAEVFDDTHRLLRELLTDGTVTGVRIDHIDGLWDPEQYLERLAALAPPEKGPTYVLVEKILTEGEQLPAVWATHGTSGYEFAGNLIDLLLDATAAETFTCTYENFIGKKTDPEGQTYALKLAIMEELFPNAVETLIEDLEAHVKSDRRWRDWTGSDLRLALSRIIACLQVYRTYRRVGQPMTESDVAVVESAVAEALRRNPASDPMPFRFVRDVWIGRYPDAQAEPGMKAWAEEWVCKLQQYTGAIMAKSIEDTFFYRYVRCFAANEVGHHPACFGRPVGAFHTANRERREAWPANLLGTSTHDTKLSEDARARLLALSHLPERWAGLLASWRGVNRAFKTKIGDVLAPSANEEYLLYQILLAAWPLDHAAVDDVFRTRIRDYLRKALAEAKENTTWAVSNEPWLQATCDFADALLDRARAGDFWETFAPFAAELSWRGALLSLVQTTLKLTAPGVPDIYQGCEAWDFSLVDPDNRRPVDYAPRPEALNSAVGQSAVSLLESWRDGRIKMQVHRAILTFRRDHPQLFGHGAYVPVTLEGDGAEDFVAYLREVAGEQVLVVAAIRLRAEFDLARLGQGLRLVLPGDGTAWNDLLAPGRQVSKVGSLSLAEVLHGLPIGVLERKI